MKKLSIRGARQHNLKNISIELPRNQLIVFSGPSGSGKSSLAFDTIFAEGQRRFVESLSAYVRQFLGRLEKPKVDSIEGLSPAISIEQKSTNHNPRSTVGTITEITDYLRLLFARIGVPYDPVTGNKLEKQTVDEIVAAVLNLAEARCVFYAPVVQGKKGQHEKIFESARKSGFTHARVDGERLALSEDIQLEKNKKHEIFIQVDRIKIDVTKRTRIVEAVETALELSNGFVQVYELRDEDEIIHRFSQEYAFSDQDMSLPKFTPALFSFNSPYGACPTCHGLGVITEFDERLIIADDALSFNEGALKPYNPKSSWNRYKFDALSRHFGINLNTPLSQWTKEEYTIVFYGHPDTVTFIQEGEDTKYHYRYEAVFGGVFADLKKRYQQTTSEGVRRWLNGFMKEHVCSDCKGERLRKEARCVRIAEKNITEISALSVVDALQFFSTLELNDFDMQIAEEILKEIRSRLMFLNDVGLNYLSLSRSAATLSGGEAQRIRLASQLGSSLVGVLYVLDEPTIGLHQRDNARLIHTLKHLRDLGNTVLVVEHDEQMLSDADYLVDLGPAAGVHGGQITAAGTVPEVRTNEKSLTGQYLSKKKKVHEKRAVREGNGRYLTIRGARLNNLRSVDVNFPLGTLTIVSGVSGSGKSSLVNGVLLTALKELKENIVMPSPVYDSLEGVEHIDKVLQINQSPIGRTPRSNPATYIGLFQKIRDLYAQLPEAKARGYLAGRFSFNVKGGRCENCQGSGVIKIDMQFLPDVFVQCSVCKGKRFTQETLEIQYRGKNINEILEMTVDEAADHFKAQQHIVGKLKTLQDVGLGYIKLGQSALTLSGGEAQRVKLSLELSKRASGNTLYVMDEPTTGLHFDDIRKLLLLIHRLVDTGNTVVIIEHNIDVICSADHIIDLGPDGGDRGGYVVATGTPSEIAGHPESSTGRFIHV